MDGEDDGRGPDGGTPDGNRQTDAEAPRETYDRIAEHFASTREYPWPEVSSFLDDHASGAQRGLDLGCGNGRHAEAMAESVAAVVGFDASRGLLEQAVERATERGFGVELVQGDAAELPFRDGEFDIAVYVATLHHLGTREARVRSLSELARVLRPEGRALVSVWSTEHDRFDAEEGFDTTVDWTLPGGERVPRFYHIYAPEEFESDLGESDLRVREAFVSSGNCYAVVSPA
ncbi:class I SAM-dependent methyltransferase [Halopelagius longus]|uniref:Class I SAM-dependent methyltransferase n=1 Tax=Halopelagius longus TaxID=1236180 RepID=A0A1H1BWF9_9EURY|nr:class I SAM-dependent methyltransferase [Halopelagius longus]RDI70954.1 class I SAM-dependent methyltransferase [Halopelagius longus]SDQ56249.1 Methyltransferase domain-containing protein [Halopelagius longus]